MDIRYKKELYSKSVLFHTCYRFTDHAYIHLDTDETDFIVSINPKDANDPKNYVALFSNQIIEEASKEDIREKTKNIRQILFARAMASSVIFESEDDNEEDNYADDKSAMRDWFDYERDQAE